MSILIAFLLTLLFVLLYLYIHHRLIVSKHWSKANIPHVEPLFLLGNFPKANITENFIFRMKQFYLDHRNEKLIGFWIFRAPILLVNDPDLIRQIFIKDFEVFHDRIPFDDKDFDPLTGHLFLLSGKPWRNLRVKLTPTFTSGKMKMMFPTMMKCGDQLRDFLEDCDREIEVKELMARFTTDVISSCAFGIETNSLKNPHSEFRKYGDRISATTWRTVLVNMVRNVFPNLIRLFQIRTFPKDISNFFINSVKEVIAYRKMTNGTRNDFIQLLMQLLDQGKVEDVDKNRAKGNHQTVDYKFTELEAAAQCFVFFLAGFETSSTALSYALYELAVNPDIQTKVQMEIDKILSDGEITYDKLGEMKYLEMVIQETLRKYPSLGILVRTNSTDYRFPGTNMAIPKNTRIFVSAIGIHYNPDYYPEPNRFDPERFSPEEKKKRDPITYLPFGDGPRNCIGSRFGLMQMKIGLVSMLRDNSVEMCKKTPLRFEIEPKRFFLVPKDGIPLVLKRRV